MADSKAALEKEAQSTWTLLYDVMVKTGNTSGRLAVWGGAGYLHELRLGGGKHVDLCNLGDRWTITNV